MDTYMAHRQPSTFLQKLGSQFVLSSPDVSLSGTKYDVALLNAVVFYVGIQVLISTYQDIRFTLGAVSMHWVNIFQDHSWKKPGF